MLKYVIEIRLFKLWGIVGKRFKLYKGGILYLF